MMKLGTETASLTNHLYSRATIGQPEPTVGMGATLLGWTDRHAGTIVQTFRRGQTAYLIVKEDTAKRTDKNGMSESQEYAYTANPDGAEHTFRLTKTGTWQLTWFNGKRYVKAEGYSLRLGERRHYHDFSF